MDFSPQQSRALDAVASWLRVQDKPVFYLAGYAGTGKTSLAKYFANGVGGQVLFASFTGKAASVMRAKGCLDAKTIHSLIYHPREKSGETLRRLEADLECLQLQDPPDLDLIERKKEDIAREKKNLKQPAFELNPDSDLRGASLLIIDECSMVGEQMGIDLLAFEVPVLVLGDPAQLPPVRSAGFFTNRMPDVMLTEIHRQEADNPIIEMATRVREGRGLPYGRYGDSQVLRLSEFDRDATIRAGVQILVGRNETRRRANARVRAARGFTDVLPVPGDRLVCCRNDHDVGLLNGTIWSVDSVLGTGDDTQYLRILGEDGGDLVVEVHQAPFRGEEVSPWIRREAEEFDFGYALTCHKAQGSQWDEVVIIDESACFRQDANRWAYTAITRASKKVTMVR